MKKPHLTIEEVGGEIVKNTCNEWKMVDFKFKIGNYEDNYRDVREINGEKYYDKYLCTNIMLYIIDCYGYWLEFNFFEGVDDIVSFMQMFGYIGNSEACERGLKTAFTVKKLGNELKKYWGSEPDWEMIDRYREIYSDGNPKKVLGVYDELVEKFFDFDIEKDLK